MHLIKMYQIIKKKWAKIWALKTKAPCCHPKFVIGAGLGFAFKYTYSKMYAQKHSPVGTVTESSVIVSSKNPRRRWCGKISRWPACFECRPERIIPPKSDVISAISMEDINCFWGGKFPHVNFRSSDYANRGFHYLDTSDFCGRLAVYSRLDCRFLLYMYPWFFLEQRRGKP